MPTGYTAPVADGTITTLRDYALRCARGMGALISMRDERPGAPIPREIAVEPYHKDEAAIAEQELRRLQAMTAGQIHEAASKAFTEAILQRNARRAAAKLVTDRYDAMLDKVKNWPSAGTPEGLRSFMLNQLVKSRDQYDNGDFDPEIKPADYADLIWHARAIDTALRDFSYHTEEYAKVVSHTAAANAWLAQLWAALPPEEKVE